MTATPTMGFRAKPLTVLAPAPAPPPPVLHVRPAPQPVARKPYVYTMPAREDVPDGATLDLIIRCTCEVLAVTPEAMRSVRRHPNIVASRRVVTQVARAMTHASFPDIAVYMGRTNHSTFITNFGACRRVLALPRGDAGRTLTVRGQPLDLQDAIDRVAEMVRDAMRGGFVNGQA